MASAESSGVTLNLSEDEAQALADVLAFVGGNPETTRRNLIDNVLEALRSTGIDRVNLGTIDIVVKDEAFPGVWFE